MQLYADVLTNADDMQLDAMIHRMIKRLQIILASNPVLEARLNPFFFDAKTKEFRYYRAILTESDSTCAFAPSP